MAVRLAAPPDRRAVLAAGVARARLRRDRGADLQHRRLARLVRRPGVPDAGALRRAVAHARRELGPLVAARRASPGPNLDELHEIARFFDRHLRGVDNGWDDEPPIVWFEHEFAPPSRSRRRCPAAGGRRRPIRIPATTRADAGQFGAGGRWRTRRPTAPPTDGVDTFRHRPTTGTRGALSWGAGDPPNGLARDLRPDEDAGPTYTSEPLARALEVLGVPEVVVHVAVDAPVATLSVRLSDVAPDGTSRW